MAWTLTQTQWQYGEEPSREDDYPVDANVLLYEGEPVGLLAATKQATHLTAGPAIGFAGFALRSVDNSTTGAANPNLLNFPNTGTGLAGGAYVRVRTKGRIRLLKSLVPGAAIAGIAGTQADVNTVVYYDGTNFLTTVGTNVKIGTVAAVGLTNSGAIYWDIEFQSDPNRTA